MVKIGTVDEWKVGKHLCQAMSTPSPLIPPPLLPDAKPQEKDGLNAVCSSEIRLLQQRSGLAGYRALPDPLTPLAGKRVGQGTQGGSVEGPKEKERVERHSTGHLLQDTPVQSFPTNVANRKPMAKHPPGCQNI